MRSILFVLTVLGLGAAGARCQPSCSGQGATLDVSGGRLGDDLVLTLSGSPGVAGVLGFDLGAGSGGLLCLDLGPAFGFVPVLLDGAGAFGLTVRSPASAALDGLTVHLQAGLVDFAQPTGVALSNGASASFRAPRVYIATPSFGSLNTGAVGYLDALTLAITPLQNPVPNGSVVDVAEVPAYGWLLTLRDDGMLVALDRDTGAVQLSVTLPAGLESRLAVSPDQTLAAVCYTASTNPFLPPTPPSVQTVALPSGALGPSVPITALPATAFLAHPETSLVYGRAGNGVVAVDYAQGVELPSLSLSAGSGTIVDWTFAGGPLFALINENGVAVLNGVNTNTNTVLAPAALSIGATSMGTHLRVRRTPGGDVLGALAPGSGQLVEISTTGLQVTSSFFIAPSIDLIEASSLGTERLLAQGAAPHQLSRLDPASGIVTTIGGLSTAPNVSSLVTLQSQSVPLCLAIIPSTTLVPLVTDPVATIPSVPVTLPWVGALSILVFNE